MKSIFSCLLLLAACSPSATPHPSPTPKKIAEAPAEIPSPKTSTGPALDCKHPFRWLAEVPVDDLAKSYCGQCECYEDRIGILLLENMVESRPLRCREFDYLTLLMGAYFGEEITDPSWSDYFVSKPWYRPKPDPMLSESAAANQERFRNLAAECHTKDKDEVSAKERESISNWFSARAKGNTALPDKLFVDGVPASQEDTLRFLDGNGYHFDARTYMGQSSWFEGLDNMPTGDRVVFVSPGMPNYEVVCSGEDCEGYESISFLLREGSIIGLSLGASACPFVYVENNSQWVKQGEILRNLKIPALEDTQKLALPAAPSCNTELRVRISEEKSEQTYLDSVYLRVGDSKILPLQCDIANPPAYCLEDQRYHLLSQGDSTDLRFAIPPALACEAPEIVANGYYRTILQTGN